MLSDTSIILYANGAILFLGVISAILFILSLRVKSILHNTLFQHMVGAFFLLTWSRIPSFIFGLGLHLPEANLIPFRTTAFIATLAGYLIFYRGLVGVVTQSSFWVNKFPLVVGVVLTPALFILYALSHQDPENFFLATRILYHFFGFFFVIATISLLADKSGNVVGWKARSGLISLMVGWFLFLFADVALALYLLNPTYGSFLYRLDSAIFAPIIFLPSYILIFIGAVLLGYFLDTEHHTASKFKPSAIFIVIPILLVVFGFSALALKNSNVKLEFVSESGKFISLKSEIPVDVKITADIPINAISISIKIPDGFDIATTSTSDSIVQIFVDNPNYDPEKKIFTLSGIIPGGWKGVGEVVHLVVTPQKIGQGTIEFVEPRVLAHDGKGTEVPESISPITFYVKSDGVPAPTIDPRGNVTIRDLSIALYSIGQTSGESERFDVNSDGVINLSDLSILISLMGK